MNWFKKNGLFIFTQYTTQSGNQKKIYSQLVVPAKFRDMVMKLAYDSLFHVAGHPGKQRTVAGVISEFF